MICRQSIYILSLFLSGRLVVSVPEAYTGYWMNQGKADFTVITLPIEIFSVRVNRLAAALDIRLRFEYMELDVNIENRKLLPGLKKYE